jgi:hypothetical protein
MELNIDNINNVPSSEKNLIYNVFKNVKVSVVGILVIVVIIYVAMFLTLGKGNGDGSSTGRNIVSSLLELFLWILLIYIVYISIKGPDRSGVDFKARLNNLWGSEIADLSVDVDLSSSQILDGKPRLTEKKSHPEKQSASEVFHITGNSFTYEQAKEACDLYGARLATYEEIEKAYDNGANWCSYGWSEDQMAFFPTQLKVYNELKTLKGHENDCGRPGINGGFIQNPSVKFGANCYGKKPKAKSNDMEYMHRINHTPSPYVDVDEKKEDKTQKLNNYTVSSFNKDKWSKNSK